MIWDGTEDELVPVAGAVRQANTFDQLGYRYVFDLFTGADHFALAVNDEYAPVAKFLGEHTVKRNPAHVTYVVNPTMDFRKDGTVANHAYWLSGLQSPERRRRGSPRKGRRRSEGFGRGDAPAKATSHTVGILTGGNEQAMPYTEQSKSWGRRRGRSARTCSTSMLRTSRAWSCIRSGPSSAATRSSRSPRTARSSPARGLSPRRPLRLIRKGRLPSGRRAVEALASLRP